MTHNEMTVTVHKLIKYLNKQLRHFKMTVGTSIMQRHQTTANSHHRHTQQFVNNIYFS